MLSFNWEAVEVDIQEETDLKESTGHNSLYPGCTMLASHGEANRCYTPDQDGRFGASGLDVWGEGGESRISDMAVLSSVKGTYLSLIYECRHLFS